MIYCQKKSGPLVVLQLKNLIGHMCLVVQSMFSMQLLYHDSRSRGNSTLIADIVFLGPLV
jgi:hypothetical protein